MTDLSLKHGAEGGGGWGFALALGGGTILITYLVAIAFFRYGEPLIWEWFSEKHSCEFVGYTIPGKPKMSVWQCDIGEVLRDEALSDI